MSAEARRARPVGDNGPMATTTQTFTVTDSDTAIAVGSGALPVLGTPRLIAWCEAVTCAALSDLEEPTTSVGTQVEIDHVAPNAVGDEVAITATITKRTGRTVQFDVEAEHDGQAVGRGSITRAIVDGERFMARLDSRGSSAS